LLLFGHLGITLVVGVVVTRIAKRQRSAAPDYQSAPVAQPALPGIKPLFALFGLRLSDWLFCAVGALLPDIIDKPVGHFLFGQVFGYNGRIFSHTLLFFIVILAVAGYLYLTRKNVWLLYLALGVLAHLILDSMWRTPQTLFWPLQGWSFPPEKPTDLSHWVSNLYTGLLRNPMTYVPEIFGLIITAVFVISYIRARLIWIHAETRSE
jgi:inner membrane protein